MSHGQSFIRPRPRRRPRPRPLRRPQRRPQRQTQQRPQRQTQQRPQWQTQQRPQRQTQQRPLQQRLLWPWSGTISCAAARGGTNFCFRLGSSMFKLHHFFWRCIYICSRWKLRTLLPWARTLSCWRPWRAKSEALKPFETFVDISTFESSSSEEKSVRSWTWFLQLTLLSRP